MNVNEAREGILTALNTSEEQIAWSYIVRLLAPWVFIAPILYFGFSVGALVATILAYQFGRRTIEHHFSRAFAAAYAIRHINLSSKAK